MREKHRGGIITIVASGEHRSSLSAFIASLPDWLPVPLVLCLMNTDGEDSTLLERLRNGCPLPIHEVTTPTLLKPGHMYTNMSGDALCLRDGHVRPPQVRSMARSALLSSAVAEHGGHTVAILLDGTLELAAAEARKVVWAGGAVFAHQTEEKPNAIIRNGIARAYKSPENLAEALGVVCMDLQRAV
ncbi:MAG: chemotaxis protein CheB [Polyangiales bacterium]